MKHLRMATVFVAVLVLVPILMTSSRDASAVGNSISGNGTTGRVAKFTGSDTIGNSQMRESAGGNMGVGATHPALKLLVNGGRLGVNANTDGNIGALIVNQNGSGPLAKFTGNTGADIKAIVDGDGDIGLGTEDPTYKVDLHVPAGTDAVRVRRQDIANDVVTIKSELGNEGTIQLFNDGLLGARLTATGDSYFNFGNFGIGTTTPDQKLEVNGSARLEENGQAVLQFARPSATSWTIGPQVADDGFVLFANGAAGFVLTADRTTGNVGLGTSTTSDPLTMASGAVCTAGGVWTDASSRDYKENISDVSSEEAHEALGQLRPRKFNYKADATEDYVGFIAEEVPDLVATSERKGLAPMDIVAVLTKVVQEQKAQIEALEARIGALEERPVEGRASRVPMGPDAFNDTEPLLSAGALPHRDLTRARWEGFRINSMRHRERMPPRLLAAQSVGLDRFS